MPQFWKVLDKNRTACHGGTGLWPEPGEWWEVTGELVSCLHGLHVCRREDLVQWLGPTIWEVEVEGEQLVAGDKVVVRRARLVKQLTTWSERTARLFACDCAEAVLPIYEKVGKSPAPRNAIAVARRFANGEATDEEMDAARAAAWAATRWAATSDATRAAAWAATRAAAWAAASDAAWAATWAAARAAAWAAARAAAWAATSAATGAATWAAASDAAWAAAGDAQTDRLFAVLYPQ